MQLTQQSAIDKLTAMGMDDLPVMEYTPQKCIIDNDWFKKYTVLRREFLSSLSDSIDQLVFLNLAQDEFINLLMGKAMPENLSLRFRIPLMWGGQLSLDNMFMCMTFPCSNNLDRFIIEQNDAQTIFLPNPETKVYLTTHSSNKGTGGNAASDRLTQIAMNMGSRGNE